MVKVFRDYSDDNPGGDFYRCSDCVSSEDVALASKVTDRIAYEHDGADEPEEVGLYRLPDGEVLVVTSWQDYTGHGCRCGTEVEVYPSEEKAIRYGLTKPQRTLIDRTIPELDGEEASA